MQWPLGKKSLLVLTGDNEGTLLAEVSKGPGGRAKFRLLAETDSPISADVTLPRLLAEAGSAKGPLAMALPTALFETAVVNLPLLPDGAVGKALPYHLAKAINKPINDFIYDWQITGRFKDRLQVTAYLFPAPLFQKARRELLKNQIEITFFEPDVFAAFAFLDLEKILPPTETSLCLLLWPDSFSLAVCEKGALPLVRTVRTSRPHGPPNQESPAIEKEIPMPTVDHPEPQRSKAESATEESEVQLLIPDSTATPGSPPQAGAESDEQIMILSDQVAAEPQASSLFFADSDDILAGFSLLSSDPDQTTTAAAEEASPKPASAETNSWPDYLQRISLEILRTRDYYASIQKGAPIKNIFIGGAESFWPELQVRVEESLGMSCRLLCSANQEATCPPLRQILAIGTGARW